MTLEMPSQKTYAKGKRLYEAGEWYETKDPRVYKVKGSRDVHTVTISKFKDGTQTESCTCDAETVCSHIITARLASKRPSVADVLLSELVSLYSYIDDEELPSFATRSRERLRQLGLLPQPQPQ